MNFIPAAAPQIGEEEINAVVRVMSTGQLAQGSEVALFEEEFSELVGGRPCVAVNSGTSALHIALLALGLGPGDEVILPSFSFAATANSVVLAGGIPIFADIDPNTFCIDVNDVVQKITSRTKAIMPVHLYGHPANLQELMKIADINGLMLIEDAAQAHGASLHGQPVGSWGHAAAFSFYPTKNMTSGEGGMITFADSSVARRARMLRNQGMEVRYQNELVGLNNRMTDVHAAIGRVQLRKLAAWNSRRRQIAAQYELELMGVKTPMTSPGALHVFHQYTIRVEGRGRDHFSDELRKRNVGSGVYYPVPIHRLPSFGMDFGLKETDLASAEVLSIPVHPGLSDSDVKRIIETVNEVAGMWSG